MKECTMSDVDWPTLRYFWIIKKNTLQKLNWEEIQLIYFAYGKNLIS